MTVIRLGVQYTTFFYKQRQFLVSTRVAHIFVKMSTEHWSCLGSCLIFKQQHVLGNTELIIFQENLSTVAYKRVDY